MIGSARSVRASIVAVSAETTAAPYVTVLEIRYCQLFGARNCRGVIPRNVCALQACKIDTFARTHASASSCADSRRTVRRHERPCHFSNYADAAGRRGLGEKKKLIHADNRNARYFRRRFSVSGCNTRDREGEAGDSSLFTLTALNYVKNKFGRSN